jgi:tetratricopeptide (TPR) repeat protein
MTVAEQEYGRLKADYFAAIDMSQKERADFLARLCQESPEHAAKLKRLLDDEGKSTIELDNRSFEIEFVDSLAGPSLSAGQLLQDRFKIVRLVGSGGMGDVYHAIDLVNNESIALKTLTGDFANDPRALSLLQSEVTLALKVSGPDVCRIYAYREPKPGDNPAIPFFTMEFLDGLTLADRLRLNGPLSWGEVKRIARDICTGLTVIHQEKIVHRDLKPRNIMLVQRSDREHAVVTDFGIAQKADPARNVEAMAGTLEYMAPEQFEGRAISPATDVFGLGVLLYELLTGVLPFTSRNQLKAVIQRATPPKPVSSLVKGIPRHWDRVIAKCLAFESEHRYQTAAEVFQALSTGPLDPDNLRRDHPRLLAIACMIPLAAILWGTYVGIRKSFEPQLNPEAQRWYEDGVTALHEGTYVTAVARLKQASDIDPGFPMIHARLAEAWEDLDFLTDAQRELLLAMHEEWRLPSLDRLLLDAIRDTIAEDYKDGVVTYARLLRKLPQRQQSAADVDLGMAYERSGDIALALALYSKAAALDPSSPAPYMHIAILQNRLLHVREADEAFNMAERLFSAEINQEGLAELHYERGYALNERYDGRAAKPFLATALAEARALTKNGKNTVPLQVRCLIQIVNADYLISTNDHGPESIEAKQMTAEATNLARDHGLDAWLADSMVIQANMSLKWHHYKEAEAVVEKALERARQTGQPRVTAKANLALASLMNLEGRPGMVVQPARDAREFYQKHGFLVLAAYSSLLMTRAHRDQLQYDQAIKSAYETLDFANRSGIRRLIMQSEETVGSVCTAAERYPEALPHYQRAISFADGQDDKDRETLNYAGPLWLAGHFQESDAALDSLPQTSATRIDSLAERIESLLSRQEYARAESMAESALLKTGPGIEPDDRKKLDWDRLVAHAHLDPGRDAVRRMRIEIPSLADPDPANPEWTEIWDKRLQLAEVELSAGLPREARQDAMAAVEFFASISRHASELRATYIAAGASQKLQDDRAAEALSKKVIDISTQLQQNWGPDALRLYLTRPDIRATISSVNLPLIGPGGKT